MSHPTAETIGKPITPQEVAAAKCRHIPAVVFDSFNIEIAQRFAGGRAVVPQAAVLARLECAGLKRREVIDSGWLNIEESYEAAGWTVSYTRPAYNESGEPYFEFEA